MTTTYDSKVSLQGHQTLRTPSSASFFIHAGIVSHYLDARPETMVIGWRDHGSSLVSIEYDQIELG